MKTALAALALMALAALLGSGCLHSFQLASYTPGGPLELVNFTAEPASLYKLGSVVKDGESTAIDLIHFESDQLGDDEEPPE